MSDNNVWNSDFGAVFKQRYDILKGVDIRKGIGGAAGGAIGHVIDPTGIIGPAIGGGLGAELDKSEKMEKEREEYPEDELPDDEEALNALPRDQYEPDADTSINPTERVPKRPTIKGNQNINREDIGDLTIQNSLRKSINSITKMIHKLDSCGGSTAGLNIKNIKAKKDGGGVYPAKAPPKPQTKRA